MKFSFPIHKADGSEYKNADELLRKLQSESTGRWLLGSSGFWHGGIHISDRIAPHCKDRDMVRCMGTGEIVAYRLNADYCQSQWHGSGLRYSTGFCLVRHRYVSPAAEDGKINALTFFTLYMHVAPVSAYGGTKADDPVLKVKANGLRVRDRAGVTAPVLGTIDRGAELVLKDLREIKDGTATYAFAQATLQSGAIRYADVSRRSKRGDTVWLALHKSQDGSDETYAEILPSSVTHTPAWWPGKVRARVHRRVSARDAASATSQRIGLLAVGTELEFHLSSTTTLTLDGRKRTFAECRCLSGGFSGNSDPPPERFWVCIDPDFVIRSNAVPDRLDQVVTCNIPIEAGDPVGRLGLHETAVKGGGKRSRHQVHVEMFSGDPRLPDFLANKAGIKQGAQYLKIPKAAPLFDSDGRTPPRMKESQLTLGDELVVPASSVKKVSDVDQCDWYELTESNQCGRSHVKCDAVETLSQHDWLKLGFQTVEAAAGSDGFVGKSTPSPFFRALYEKVTKKPAPSDCNELRAGLINASCQERGSKLIVHQLNEWKAKSGHSYWNPLDAILADSPDRSAHEKERIDSSMWWDQVAEAVKELPAGGRVWHFHPVALTKHVMLSGVVPRSSGAISGLLTYEAEGVEDKKSPYFSRVIHWPGTENSGVTLGRGYDMGSRSVDEVRRDLIQAGVSEEKSDLFAKGAGVKGSVAKRFVLENKEKLGEITMQQQIDLFNLIYPGYVERTKANYDNYTNGRAGKLPWSNLDPVIKEVLVDFVYQGFTKGPRPMEAGMKNDVEELIRYIKRTPDMNQYEAGRKRVLYLEKNR